MNVTLPWPPKELSPNARVHWGTKAKTVKAYHSLCYYHCGAQSVDRAKLKGSLSIVFHPPSKRRMDLDNMLASFKSGCDAISDFLKIDDSKFTITIAKGEPVKGGKVEVTIT